MRILLFACRGLRHLFPAEYMVYPAAAGGGRAEKITFFQRGAKVVAGCPILRL
jgi:hypothetical protein